MKHSHVQLPSQAGAHSSSLQAPSRMIGSRRTASRPPAAIITFGAPGGGSELWIFLNTQGAWTVLAKDTAITLGARARTRSRPWLLQPR